MAANIQVGRSLNELPRSEIVDTILQYVLYHRRQVPAIVPALLRDSADDVNPNDFSANFVQELRQKNGKKVDQFRTGFVAVRDGIARFFRSIAGGEISRVAIVIGSSPSYPTDLYFIQFPTDHEQRSQNDENVIILDSITNNQRRNITRQLIEESVCYDDFKEINRPMKTFVLIEAKCGCNFEDFDPRDDLNLQRYIGGDGDSKKKRVNSILLRINGDGDIDESSQSTSANASSATTISKDDDDGRDEEEKEVIWYQFRESIVGFNA